MSGKCIEVRPEKSKMWRCCCGEPLYLSIEQWNETDPEPYTVGFVGRDGGLRSLLRQWWHSRRCWLPSIALTRQQMVELRDGIDRLLAD